MITLLSKNEADYLIRQHREGHACVPCVMAFAVGYRASGLVRSTSAIDLSQLGR